MADISKISPDDGSTILNIKDATARSQITDAYKVMGELTDAVTPVDITSELTVEIGTLNNGASKILKTGRLITLSMRLTGVTANANQALAKLPKKYRPVNNIQFFGGIKLSGEDNLRHVAYSSTTDYLEFQCPYAISNKTVTFIPVSWIIQ